MPPNAQDYRAAALERMTDANLLRRQGNYSFAMYAGGVAVECMLRSFRHPDRPFDEHHDVVALFNSCDEEKLGDGGRKRLRAGIQTVHQLWLNNFRYKAEERLRQYLKDTQYYARARLVRGADELKVACIELCDAATTIVTVGEERWRTP